MDALERAGHRVELASTFRSYDGAGDIARQAALREQGEGEARRLAAEWRAQPPAERPDLWFTYHLYYKAPDWLGPGVSEALGIPYVVAEASYAPKRAGGAWALGHEASAAAIRKAALVVCPSRDDIRGLEALLPPQRIVHLPPFLDTARYTAARANRPALRARFAGEHGIQAGVPWIVAAAMMRSGDKLASYRRLAEALERLDDRAWRLVVAGDGPARAEVERVVRERAPGRAHFLGALAQQRVAELFAAADFCAWPAVNEAYGMALLEAQAAGIPVVSCDTRGVPDVVQNGRTGLLVPYGDQAALAHAMRELLTDEDKRARLGGEAWRFVAKERSLETAARRLGAALAAL